ncbi:signal peptidase I [Psychromicrobium sp. YIM B11713]|uniref:signal peptidase I n=1 Tax=Psychromicrobium sp. YIM B11713 TaxID=3145233 RepID=UPI00374EB90E
MKRNSGRNWLRETALTVGAILGLICLLAMIAAVFFGITPVVFRSGSMAPAIDTGSLAITQSTPAAQLHTGDVVSVDNSAGERITHRIVAIQPMNDGEVLLSLKGDANLQADLQTYQLNKADKVLFAVPGLGYLVAWLQSPWAIFLGGLIVGVLLTLAFRPGKRARKDASPSNHPAQQGSSGPPGAAGPANEPGSELSTHSAELDSTQPVSLKRRVKAGYGYTALLIGVLLAFTAGSVFGGVQQTLAAFQDTSVASSGSLLAATLPQPAPNPPNCAASGIVSSATVSWNAATLPAGAQYRLRYSGLISGTVMLGSTTSYTFSGSLLGGLGLSSGRLTVQVDTVIPGTNWVSTVATRTVGYSITIIIASFTC